MEEEQGFLCITSPLVFSTADEILILLRRTLLRVVDQRQFRLTRYASGFGQYSPVRIETYPLGRAADVRT